MSMVNSQSSKPTAVPVAPTKDGQTTRRHSASGQITFEWDKEEEQKPQLWQRFLGQNKVENIKVSDSSSRRWETANDGLVG